MTAPTSGTVRSRRTARLGGCLLAAVGLVAVGTPAQAADVLPRTAPLLHPDGRDSTCDLTVSGSTWVGTRGDRVLQHKAVVACAQPGPWHRLKITLAASVLADDGSRTTLYSGGYAQTKAPEITGGSTASKGPICEAGIYPGWAPEAGRSYTVVLRSVATLKETYDNTGTPWRGVAERAVTFTC